MNCLVTKLKGVVDNPNIPILGELRIEFLAVESPTKYSQEVTLEFTENTEVHVLNGTFVDENLVDTGDTSKTVKTQNILYVSNGSTLCISNKYAIKVLNIYGDDNRNKFFNLSDLSYSTALTTLDVMNTSVVGDLSDIENLVNVRSLNISRSSITGNISSLRKFANLLYFLCYYTNISGDVESLAKGIWEACGHKSSEDRGTSPSYIWIEGCSSRTNRITYKGIVRYEDSLKLRWDSAGNAYINELD